MDKTTFDRLPREFPRRFISDDFDLTALDALRDVAKGLLKRPVRTADGFERWTKDLFEFRSALGEEYNKYYILSTCHTDDKAIQKMERHFSETVFPGLAEQSDRLNRKFVALFEKIRPDPARYTVPARAYRANVQLFRKKNVPLETEAHRLSQDYFAVRGGMTVHFDGKERTMSEMFKLLESPDADLRKRAFLARAEREMQDRGKIDAIYDRLVELRDRIARNAGFDRFTEYQYLEYKRFDYGPKECHAFHKAVEAHAIPLVRKLHRDKLTKAGLKKLRPWDIHFDPAGREPLKPFKTDKDLVKRTARAMDRIDPQFGVWTRLLAAHGLLDLTARKGKAPGGYSSTLPERRFPFIFMNAAGTDFDIRTMFHELGHAFHSLSVRGDGLNYNAHLPMEFNEVASMSQELFASEVIDEFYPDPADARRSNDRALERVITLLPSVATIDAFQHWIYDHPAHSRAERDRKWNEFGKRFGSGLVDWTGYEEYKNHGWQNILHIIEVPFYYIEYAIAQIGALQVWMNARRDRGEAIRLYKRGLAAGVTKTLPELYAAAGIVFNFGTPILKKVTAELDKARFGKR